MLLLPVLLPIVAGIFVFRQKNEKIRNRLVLITVSATAALVLAVCLLPTQSLELMTIQGTLRLSMENDGLSRFFMVLIVGIWAPVSIFSFPYLRHAGARTAIFGLLYHVAGSPHGAGHGEELCDALYVF